MSNAVSQFRSFAVTDLWSSQRCGFVGMNFKKFAQSCGIKNANNRWLEVAEKQTAALLSRQLVSHDQFAECGTGNKLDLGKIKDNFSGGRHFHEAVQFLAKLKYFVVFEDATKLQSRNDRIFMSYDIEVFWFFHPFPTVVC